jgi:PiT family inorganic phosphate transporter
MNAVTVGMPVLSALVATALLFDFLNGLHDSANSIATIVATRVLRPFTAVLWASFFNFIAFTVFGLHVAATMGNGVVNAGMVDPLVVFGALAGAIVWNLLTWWLISSSGPLPRECSSFILCRVTGFRSGALP